MDLTVTDRFYSFQLVSCLHSNILAGRSGHHKLPALTPDITGFPLPIEGCFSNLLTSRKTISYRKTNQSIIINITFPTHIVGRLYAVGIQSDNVYRIQVELVESISGVVHLLTTPNNNKTMIKQNTNPRLTGLPAVSVSEIRVILLDTVDGLPPCGIRIYTKGCFYKSSVRYTTLPAVTATRTTKKRE